MTRENRAVSRRIAALEAKVDALTKLLLRQGVAAKDPSLCPMCQSKAGRLPNGSPCSACALGKDLIRAEEAMFRRHLMPNLLTRMNFPASPADALSERLPNE